MGSRRVGWVDEAPIHRVFVSQPFYLGVYPVTQSLFAEWTRTEKVEHENDFKDLPEHPAESMDWNQCVAFCDWINRKCCMELDRIERGLRAALPSEAQWEYACRAGTTTDYCAGDGESALRRVGWFGSNSENTTQPIGEKDPNAWGLHDMHGNVEEWCADVWDDAAYRKREDGWEAGVWTCADAGIAADQNAHRVLRGGSWYDTAGYCRAAFRDWYRPVDRYGFIGFRVCLVPGPETAGRGAPTASSTGAEPAPGDGGRRMSPESEGAGGAGFAERADSFPAAGASQPFSP
jgi:formylglycine-generating enzyme required for sulfatase activity